MNQASKVTALVDRGLQLHHQIEAAQKELKQIEVQLRSHALTGEQQPLNDPDRDGRQYLAQGTNVTVPIILTADILTQSFGDGSPTHRAATAIAGDDLITLYRPITTWKMLAKTGKAFRTEAHARLAPEQAARLITALTARDKDGIPKSTIRTEWDRATPSVSSVSRACGIP